MSAALNKAAEIRAPNDRAAADDFGSKLYTCTNVLKRNSLPPEWFARRWVIVRNLGSVGVWYGFSTRQSGGSGTSTVLAAPAATDAGTSTQVGEYIAPGEVQQVELPDWVNGESMFFIRIVASGASADMLLRLGDGE